MIKSKLQKLFFYSVLSFSISHSYHAIAQEASPASSQISSLINAGQFEQALVAIDGELKNNPKDPLLRFQHGISLAGLGKNDEAIVDFTRLTEEYPQLPEPYNNLAVIYAYKGQLDKSRAALELAIKANPNYVAAHDNLGDVFSKLAASHYEKAVSLDNKNDSAKSKLNILSGIANLPIGSRQIYNAGNVSSQKPAFSFKSNANNNNDNVTSSDATPTKKELAKQANIEKLEKLKAEKELKDKLKAEKAKIEKVEKPAKKEVEKTETVEKSIKPSISSVNSTKPTVAQQAKPSVSTTPPAPVQPQSSTKSDPADEQEVIKTVNSWAGAWSNKNVDSYLGHYSSGFKPADGSSRSSWESGRKNRIGDKGNIDVTVSNPKVTVSGDTATVNFKQVYKSDKLHDTTQKTLVMVKVNGKWQIKQEKGN